MRFNKWLGVAIFLTSASSLEANTETFFTLLEPSSARATALGESFSAIQNDIAGFQYNPATLSTLSSNQASFLFEKQYEQEKYSFFSIGIPRNNFSLGGSVAYFDTGTITLFDGEKSESVVGQRDLIFSAGASKRFHQFSLGLKPKIISTEISETKKIQTLAMDGGILFLSSARLSAGFSIQNLELSGAGEEDLPRVIQGGFFYLINENAGLAADLRKISGGKILPSLGYELAVGPLALRAGVKKGEKSNIVSLGSGIRINQFQLHYAANFIPAQDLRHQFSMTYSFGRKSTTLENYSNPSDPPISNDNFDSLEILNRESESKNN